MLQTISRLGLTLIIFTTGFLSAVSQDFVTTWKTDNPGTSGDTQITIPTVGVGYDYTVDWGDGAMDENVTGEITHTYSEAGTYTVSISGFFPRIYFNNAGDKEKILTIESWGEISWTSMASAFSGCSNLTINASDAPDLSNVTTTSSMFSNATSLDSDLNHWDVSNVENMGFMFRFATAFSGDISSWDVSSVTTMFGTFSGATTFNGNIGSWDVSSLTNLNSTFSGASSFNQDLSGWDVSQVITMSNTFSNASSFNGDVSGWDVSSVTMMAGMFNNATAFTGDLSGWDVSNVTTMTAMLNSTGISAYTYDAMLTAWSALNLQNGVTLGATGINYCNAATIRDFLTNNFGWNVSDSGQDCPPVFITTWKTDNPGTSGDTQITIPTSGTGYNYSVDWGDGRSDAGVTGDITHTYETAGTYTVSIIGDFPLISFNGQGDKEKILTVEQWGTGQWTGMNSAFQGCSNLTITATDTPDLSMATSTDDMFRDATSLTGGVANWDVSNIAYMAGMFWGATSFNDDLSNWNTSSAIDMRNMFSSATSFNSDISSWQVGSVEEMNNMFSGATSFNSDISGWDVSSVVFINGMFSGATAFNIDLSSWDVSSVRNFQQMFHMASSFEGNIGSWNIASATSLSSMLSGSGVTSENYEKILVGWANNPSTPSGLTLSVSTLSYCLGAQAKDHLVNNLSWTIFDSGIDCSEAFVTSWKTDNPGVSADDQITIPTLSSAPSYDFAVDWGDGNVDFDVAGDITHTYALAGTYPVTITGDFPAVYFQGAGDKDKILSVEQWGSTPWLTFFRAFEGCSNLNVTATDAPDLPGPNFSMQNMFAGASSLTADLNHWDVSGVSDMTGLFFNATSFNGNIGGWNVSNVRGMYAIFSGASNFDQDLSSWNVSSVTNMGQMFKDATSFNGNVSSWSPSGTTSLAEMFSGASSFNGDLSSWDVSGITHAQEMFRDATSFDGDLSNWEVSGLRVASSMFAGATSFQSDLSSWNISSLELANNMLDNTAYSTLDYDNILAGWITTAPSERPLSLGAAGLTYCLGETARSQLINAFGWTITGDALDCPLLFITTWKTDNIGESADNQITIPTNGTGYNYAVSWGDGSVDINLQGDATHTYDSPGIYTISITGEFPRIYFNNAGDKEKILSVEAWGDISWASMESAFSGCSNLVINATDAPDLSGVTSLQSMFMNASSLSGGVSAWDVSNVTRIGNLFSGATSFNEDLSSWDVSGVTNMLGTFFGAGSFNSDLSAWNVGAVTDMFRMFEGCVAFNQDISSWDVGSVQNMQGMFKDASSFNQNLGAWNVQSVNNMTNLFDGSSMSGQNYDLTLGGWVEVGILQQNVTVGAQGLTYCLSGASRDLLANDFNWNFVGDVEGECSQIFITTWKTDNPGTSNDNQITIPTIGTGYFYGVSWGDGTIDVAMDGNQTHTYATPGTYTVKIAGDFPQIYFNNGGDKEKILTVEQWGNPNWSSMSNAFSGCSNLTIPAIDAPDLSNVTNMTLMFQGATSLNQPLEHWDVSNITSMRAMFQDASSFNQPLNGWDVSRVIDMQAMFLFASSFNQPLDSWNTSQVTNMATMFAHTSFNQPLGNWDMSGVQNLSYMLRNAASFNQDLSSWDVSSATSMEGLFLDASSFEQELGSWDISSVSNLTGMLENSGLSLLDYRQTLSGWSHLPTLPSNLTLGAGGLLYCTGEASRETLTNDFGWTIVGDIENTMCSSEADITTLTLPEQSSSASIDLLTHEVEIIVTSNTFVAQLSPTIQVSTGASISPESQISLDFSNPVTYTVTAEDGSQQDWLVTVIPQQTQSIVFDEIVEQTYGGAPVTLGAVASSGLDVTYVIESGDQFASLSENVLTIIGAGEVTVTASQSGNDLIEEAESVTRTFLVQRASLTVSAEDKTITYGEEFPTLTVAFEGFVNGELASSLDLAPQLEILQEDQSAGVYVLRASGASSANYDINYEDGSLTIEKAPLIVTAEDQSVTYGQELPGLSLVYSGFVLEDDIAALSSVPVATTIAEQFSNVGSYAISISAITDDNYEVSVVDGTLTVEKAPLIVSADDIEINYGDPIPSLIITIEGFVGSDDEQDLNEKPVASTSANQFDNSGAYEITPSGGVDNNYEYSYSTGTLNINKRQLTIKANDQAITYGEQIPTQGLSFEGFVNEENETVLDELPTANVEAQQFDEAGEYVIVLSGGVDNNYDYQLSNGTLTVGKAAILAAAEDVKINYGNELPTFSISYEGFVGDDSSSDLDLEPMVSTEAGQFSDVGIYELLISGGSDNNYFFNYTDGNLTVEKATLVASTEDLEIIYGSELPTLSIDYQGFVGDDSSTDLDLEPTVSTTAVDGSEVGSYDLIISGGSDNNYTFNYTDGELRIEQAMLTARADDQEINEGEALPTFSVTYEGFVNSDDESELDQVPNASVNIADSSTPGQFDITLSGGIDNNYEIVHMGGTLTINEVLGLGPDSEVRVFPNPASEYIEVNAENMGSLEVLSLEGKLKLKSTKSTLDVSSLSSGTYLLLIRNSQGEIVSKRKILKVNLGG